jgi:hypothetical protein
VRALSTGSQTTCPFQNQAVWRWLHACCDAAAASFTARQTKGKLKEPHLISWQILYVTAYTTTRNQVIKKLQRRHFLKLAMSS